MTVPHKRKRSEAKRMPRTPIVPTKGLCPPKNASASVYVPGKQFKALEWPKVERTRSTPSSTPKRARSAMHVFIPAPLRMGTSTAAEKRFTLASAQSAPNAQESIFPSFARNAPERKRPERPFTSHGEIQRMVTRNAAVACDELDRRMDLLVENKRRVDMERSNLVDHLHAGIEEGKRMLPLDFLFQRNMREYAHKRGGGIVLDAMKRFVNALASEAMLIWKEHVAQSRSVEREQKSIVIQAFARMVIVRKGVLPARRGRGKCKKTTTKHIKLLLSKRECAAVSIQKVCRGFGGRKAREHMRHRLHCIVKVQSLWRARKCKLAMEVHKFIKERRLKSAIKIQSAYRGYLGRLEAERQRKRVKNQVLERKLGSFDYVVGRRFAETGAATVIQRNWRKIHSRETIKFQWHETAATIQSAFRGMMDRRIAKAMREKKQFDHYVWANRSRMKAAALMVQRRFRIHTSRKRLRSLRDVAAAAKKRRMKEKEKVLTEKVVKVGLMGVGVSLNVTKGRRLLRGLNVFRRNKRPRSAMVIQNAWRSYVARKKTKKMRRVRRKERYLHSALVVQAAMRGLRARAAVREIRRSKATVTIQTQWRKHKNRRLLQGGAREVIASATRIAAAYRRRKTMNAYMIKRDEHRLHTAVSTKIQARMRVYLAKRAAERTREALILNGELRHMGEVETTFALQRAKDRLYLGAVYKSSTHIEGELQNLLATLCASGNFSKNGENGAPADMRLKNRAHMLENTKLAKFCKAAGIQHNDYFPPQKVDILFAEALSKHRASSSERRLNYRGFVYFDTGSRN